MSQLSRRNALAAVAGLPAVAALPAAAVASTDTELVALGAQLKPILELWAAQTARDRRAQAHFEAKVEQATGMTFEDASPMSDSEQYWITRRAIPIDDIDESDPWTPIHAQLNPLVDKILSRKAQTISGLPYRLRRLRFTKANYGRVSPAWTNCHSYSAFRVNGVRSRSLVHFGGTSTPGKNPNVWRACSHNLSGSRSPSRANSTIRFAMTSFKALSNCPISCNERQAQSNAWPIT